MTHTSVPGVISGNITAGVIRTGAWAASVVISRGMSFDLEAAWELVSKPKKLDALYEGSDDPALKELAERITSNEGESVRVLLVEGCEQGGPYAVSRLFTDRRRWDTQGLRAGVDFGRPLLPYLEKVELEWQLPILASSPYESDRTWAIDHYKDDPETRAGFAVRLVNAGDKRGERRLIEALEAYADSVETRVDRIFGRAPRSNTDHQPARLLHALCEHPIEGAAPILVRLLRTDFAVTALIALAQHNDPSVADAVERYRSSLAGNRDVTAILRAGAANVLRGLGQRIPPDDARFLQMQSPRRYGYPDWEQLALAHRIAAEAFIHEREEMDWVRSLATSAFALLRSVAQPLLDNRTYAYWDTARVNRYINEENVEPIFEALESPNTIFVGKIVERLQEITDDEPSIRPRLVEWCRQAFERVPNVYVPDSETMPPDLNYAMYFLGDLDKEELEPLQGTTSAWLQTFVLEDGEMTRPETKLEVPEGVSAEPFDVAPWNVGKKINGLAVSPDGSRIAVLGEEHCRQIDAQTGLTALHQELRWSWGYDIAYSPDGSKLAATFHGGHVEIYESSTGKRIADLEGHSGVPNGVRCVAWSADGAMLVSGGSEGTLIAWDSARGTKLWDHSDNGSYQDVVFLPDGRVLASLTSSNKGEKNALQVFSTNGNLEIEVKRKKSIWAIAIRDDGMIALGGEDKAIVLSKNPLDKKFKTWRKLDQAKVRRLQFVGNTLYAAGEDGSWMRWDSETREGEPLMEGKSLWAMEAHGDRVFAAGNAGTVHVLEDGALQESAGASHGRRVVAIDTTEEGVVTADWDGKIIRWSREGGIGTEVAALGLTIESSAKVDNDTILYGTRKGLRLVRLSDGEVLASGEARADEVAIDGEPWARTHATTWRFTRFPRWKLLANPSVAGPTPSMLSPLHPVAAL